MKSFKEYLLEVDGVQDIESTRSEAGADNILQKDGRGIHQQPPEPTEVSTTELPLETMKEIKKNIRKGAEDLTQDWTNALELVHRAYVVTGVQRPTPDMKEPWKQYEANIQEAVKQLSAFRGRDGKWRMTSVD